jgi:hypothetical protein
MTKTKDRLGRFRGITEFGAAEVLRKERGRKFAPDNPSPHGM